MQECPKCGHPLREVDRYCLSCGRRVRQPRGRWLLAAGGVALFLTVGSIASARGRQTPRSVASIPPNTATPVTLQPTLSRSTLAAPSVTPSLTRPPATRAPTTTAAPAALIAPTAPIRPTAPVTTYVVKEGDTLWNIAATVYGDARKWQAIADANDVDNPRRLRAGTVLTIP